MRKKLKYIPEGTKPMRGVPAVLHASRKFAIENPPIIQKLALYAKVILSNRCRGVDGCKTESIY